MNLPKTSILTLIGLVFLLGLVAAYWLGSQNQERSFVSPVEVVQRQSSVNNSEESITSTPSPRQRVRPPTQNPKNTEQESSSEAGANTQSNEQEDQNEVTDQPLALAKTIVEDFSELSKASEEDLRQSLEYTEALIQEAPDLYGAYKSKLIIHLLLELKYGSPPTPDVYEELYNELLQFSGPSENDTIALRADLFQQGFGGNMDENENQVDVTSEELIGMDPDLVHIPFLRFAALGDYASLTALANEYIEAFPDSHIGYQYMAEAAWRSGEEELAVGILSEGLGDQVSSRVLTELLDRLTQQSPMQRIYEMDSGIIIE